MQKDIQRNITRNKMVKHKIKLALGSGWRNYGSDWTHIDGGDYEHLDSKDITKLLYADNSVDVVYASHVLEYFDREEVTGILKEWHRVLKTDGEIYIAVPDFEAMARLYTDKRIPLRRFLGPLYGKMAMGDETIFHKTVYDYSELGELLGSNGFKSIGVYNQDDLLGKVDDHSRAEINGQSISLNMRGVKR